VTQKRRPAGLVLLGALADAQNLPKTLRIDGCLYQKLDSAIMVMKSAEDRHRCDAAYVLNGAMDWSVFAKSPMSPQLIIIR